MKYLNNLEKWLFPAATSRQHPLLEVVPLDVTDEDLDEFSFVVSSCPNCAEPQLSSWVCGQCLAHPPSFSRAQALLVFNERAQLCVHEYKYQSALYYSRVFAEMMAQRFDIAGVQALIPVPLHPVRLSERGFNQSYELAKVLSTLTGIPVKSQVLKRIVDTPHQTLLNKQQRQRNLKGVFEVASDALAGLTEVALVDDVMTTGTTLEQCAKALRKSYPQLRVQVWVIARAIKLPD